MEEQQPLLPGLMDELALLCLVRTPRTSHKAMHAVCRGWHHVLRGAEFYRLRRRMGLTEGWLYVHSRSPTFRNYLRALDPATGTWHMLPQLPHFGVGQIRGLRCAAVKGRLYVFGGWREGGPCLNEAYCFDPCFNVWTKVADMASPRCYMTSCVIDGCIYVGGGMAHPCRRFSSFLVTAEKYDPEQDRWIPIANMLRPLDLSLGVSYAGQFFVRGRNPESSQVYSPESDEWSFVSRTSYKFIEALMTPCASKGALFMSLINPLSTWESEKGVWKKVERTDFISKSLVPLSQRHLQYACMTFLEGRLLLVKANSSVVAVEFKGPIKFEEEGGGGDLAVKSIEFVSRGDAFVDEAAADCFVVEV